MSWVERVKNGIVIITGDGQTYTPDYVNAEFVQGYNIASFEFPRVPGTLVKREEPKGRKFRFEILFQGDNHLEDSEQFRQSTFDKREWRITHPKYDDFVCHPQSLRFDDTKENVTRITGPLLETIEGVSPAVTESPTDVILSDKTAIDEELAVNYEAELSPDPLTSNDANLIQEDISTIESVTNTIVETGEQAAELKNKVTVATNKVTNGIGKATGFIRDVQGVINFPFAVITNVRDRINTFISALNTLTDSVNGSQSSGAITRNQKKYYETSGATSISGMCVSTVNQLDDFGYESREEVDFIVNKVLTTYNTYIETIDAVQSETATEEDSYTPTEESMRLLKEIVDFTVSRLFEVGLGSKQELILVLDADSDPVSVTHKIYGLDELDENLERIIENNDIGISEMLQIKKGRDIKYYV